ncbi:(2Fe-2S) ferredoxin domain-containing protein [Streptomyces fulvoviolaceus]|uniref:(2Fe-2S) ferredoxin domain-containing protein n=1 Tax=Streptomyces fulvoviolaceus TaxID=285535 RepID=UPI0004C97E48|nr:(2Fe-2S) ferredoxin domain-containing protein [Streptomyces fulvoviolaceus]MCT9082466.1 (2Fe-2S) ferredoxin domain-containing protein [Streptomyces fulvoviolaceus]
MPSTLIGAARQRPCTLVVCRGCCCGDPRKLPQSRLRSTGGTPIGTDHAWQLERLRAAAAEHGFQVRTTDCLGPCDQANVIVVQPSAAGRRAGGRATWVGFAMDDDCTEEILQWAAAGGPGVAEPPVTLELQFIQPPRDARVRSRR